MTMALLFGVLIVDGSIYIHLKNEDGFQHTKAQSLSLFVPLERPDELLPALDSGVIKISFIRSLRRTSSGCMGEVAFT